MSLPARHPLAQAIALAMALGVSATQADVFNVTSNADSGPGTRLPTRVRERQEARSWT